MENFDAFGLPESLNHTLKHMELHVPTPIQVDSIPLALEGHDILGSAQTGTGKTAAFGIPLITHLLRNPDATALVMSPTRELATQILSQLRLMLGKKATVKAALLIGGDSMVKQLQQLRSRPRLIVGTPGRIDDHLRRNKKILQNTNFLVLDETDRMLDMGFTIQIEAIMKFIPEARQTLLFSATIPKNIAKIASKYLNNPQRVSVAGNSALASNITHATVHIADSAKYPKLLEELEARTGSVIIFVKTKYGTERLARKLDDQGHSAEAIHGDLKQSRRNRVISSFRDKKYRILVATDVAARGLDIPHIEHVVNYDLPQCAEDYIHRIGRTARASAKGEALSLVTPVDKSKWRAIEKMLRADGSMTAEQLAKIQTNDTGGKGGGGKDTRGKGGKNTRGRNEHGKDTRRDARGKDTRGKKSFKSNKGKQKVSLNFGENPDADFDDKAKSQDFEHHSKNNKKRRNSDSADNRDRQDNRQQTDGNQFDESRRDNRKEYRKEDNRRAKDFEGSKSSNPKNKKTNHDRFSHEQKRSDRPTGNKAKNNRVRTDKKPHDSRRVA